MAFEIRENTGTLHKETDRTNPEAPEYTGELNVEGKMWRIAAWIKVAKSGKKWMSLSIEEPRAKSDPKPREGGDDIPF